MAQHHDIDTELLTALGDLPAREPAEGGSDWEVASYLLDMASEPPAGSQEARVLAAYLNGGEHAAIEEIARMLDVADERLRDMLLGQAAATVSARALIAVATGRA
jgi:hypothetical protein